jgi:hypothetical protein
VGEFVGRSAIVVCQKGGKVSQGAAAWLRHAGVPADALEDGFDGWCKAGLPLVTTTRMPPLDRQGRTVWVTRARPKVDRIACPWLIRRFIDPRAVFLFVAPAEVEGVAERFAATPFDVEACTPTAEEDAATIARAAELLRTNPNAYWRDGDLQEAQLEALERQQAAPPPEPDGAAVADQIERQIVQRNADKFAEMLRKEPAKYWASPELQRQHHEAIAAAIRETPQPVAQPAAAPNLSASPAAAPAAPAPTPAKAAVSDATRRAEIEALMRVDGGKAYWRDPGVQREYGQVLARLAGEAPPLAPAAPEAVPMSAPAEARPQDAG